MIKKIFETKTLTAAALAEEIYQQIQKKESIVNIALSGGSTPAILFSILAKKYGDKIQWNLVNFFWVDERSVPPEDDQSNYKMTAVKLLNHIDIPEGNVYRVRGEDDADKEAIRYSGIIRQIVPLNNELPVFDIILLGIGDDGHTASIFPDQMELLKSNNICEKAIHPQSGQERVTLTGPVINNGRSVYFLICGKGKKDIIEKIFNKDPLYPASYINNENGELLFYLDSEAAVNL